MQFILAIFIFNGIAGKIQGIVKDEDTGQPIPYADVVILNTDLGAATDENGNFYILNVLRGKYTIEASCIGYQSKRIENVIVEIDQTARLKISLKPTTIEMVPVVVTSEMPDVKKDMVGSVYVVKKEAITYLPVDYTTNLVNFQPSVANFDTAIHVRGGRATEVQYMIDNVSITDPQTGELAIHTAKDILDELIFLPGGFSAEYGRAMSGLINLITVYPSDQLQFKVFTKTEKIMPRYYDFGYENYQSSIHLPISKKAKGYISFDLMHTDDWNPRLFILPHKQRDDYALYGKWLFNLSSKFKLTMSGAKSRSQFDCYTTQWKFHLDHYRSDKREGNLQTFNITYLPSAKSLISIVANRLFTSKIYGVREERRTGFFKDFVFKDYQSLVWPSYSNKNPFGITFPYFYCAGDYPQFEEKKSEIKKGLLSTDLQIHTYHEFKAGLELSDLDLYNLTSFVNDSLHKVVDEYHFRPKEVAAYVQDDIDYKGLFAKLGIRYDYFSNGIDTIDAKMNISPRFGFSFLVTDKFLFRTNVGKYTQPPLYEQMFTGLSLSPIPTYLVQVPLIGNPDLKPEKTISYEIGMQGKIRENLSVTVNVYNKDVSDLIGTRFVSALPINYVTYLNVEYANIKGIETSLDFQSSAFVTNISYALSYAKGTSSYAEEVYWRYYRVNPDANFQIPATDYWLNFDQRHRLFVQGIINGPSASKFYLLGSFESGFPYEIPDTTKKSQKRNYLRLPFKKQIDGVVAKSFHLGKFSLVVNIEIVNLFDERYQIAPLLKVYRDEEIHYWDFNDYISIGNSYYHPAADMNHDGLIVPYEWYSAFKAINNETQDWVNAYGPPRRVRIGVSVSL